MRRNGTDTMPARHYSTGTKQGPHLYVLTRSTAEHIRITFLVDSERADIPSDLECCNFCALVHLLVVVRKMHHLFIFFHAGPCSSLSSGLRLLPMKYAGQTVVDAFILAGATIFTLIATAYIAMLWSMRRDFRVFLR